MTHMEHIITQQFTTIIITNLNIHKILLVIDSPGHSQDEKKSKKHFRIKLVNRDRLNTLFRSLFNILLDLFRI